MRPIVIPCLLALALLAPSSLKAQCPVAPIAVDDVATADGSLLVVDVMANDRHPGGLLMHPSVLGEDCLGTASVDDGLVIYAPVPGIDADAQCTIDYRLFDDAGNSSQVATVTLAVPLVVEGFEDGSAQFLDVCDPDCPGSE